MMNPYGNYLAALNGYAGYGNQFQPQNQMNLQNQVPVQSLIRVNGIDGAKAYQMPANSTVALFDSDNDIMYVKTTDGAGFPVIRTFAFTEVKEQKDENTSVYISRKEFEEFKEEVMNHGKQSIQKESKSGDKSTAG